MASSDVVIILGVLCGVFVILLLLAAAFLCRRVLKRRKKMRLRDTMEMNHLLVDDIMCTNNNHQLGTSAVAETITLLAQQEVMEDGGCGQFHDQDTGDVGGAQPSSDLKELIVAPSSPPHTTGIKKTLYKKRSLTAPGLPSPKPQPLRKPRSISLNATTSSPQNSSHPLVRVRSCSCQSLDVESDSSSAFSYSLSAPPSPANRPETDEIVDDDQPGTDSRRRKSRKGNKAPPSELRLEYSIYYSSVEATLVISVKRVIGISSKYAPACASFVRVYLSPKTGGGYLQTCTVRKSIEPAYNDQLQFSKIPLDEIWANSLRFKLYVKEKWGGSHECLGEATRECFELIQEADEVREVTEVLRLKRSKWMRKSLTIPTNQITAPQCLENIPPNLQLPQSPGDLFVSIQYQPTASRFKVMVRKADHLSKGARLPGAASIIAHYVTLNLLRDRQAVVQSETTRSINGSHPTWNQPFLLHLNKERGIIDYSIEFVLMRVRFHSSGRYNWTRYESSAGHQLVNVDHTRTIIHIDLDCFYAQVEMVRNPSLRTKPLGIQQKYLLVTCNYVARSRGVTKLMRVSDALQRCPDLVIVSGEDLTHYREMSYRITELFQHISPLVERLGFDENYIDVARLVAERLQGDNQETDVFGHVYGETSTEPDAMTTPICSCGCHRRLVIGSHIAHEMRQALETQLGLTSCAGVAHNKLLAKLVGTTHKPNDQTTLFPHMAGKLMGSLTKATHIPGIGHSTGKKLSSMGITTLNELIEAPLSLLKDEFGYQTASTMQRLCRGHDQSPVVQSGPPQSISDEDSFKKCSSLQQAQLKMKMLICSLLQRLRKDGRQPHTLRLSVRKYSQVHKWTRESRQCNMPDGILHSLHTDEAAAMSRLLDLCVGLFHKMVDTSKPFHLTLINVCFAKFQSPARAATDISKFFSPKPVTKGSDEAGTNNESFTRTDNNDQLASTIQAYANLATRGIDKACKSLFVCSKDDNSDRLPSGSLHSVTERTPPSSSYHEVDGRVNWSTSGHRCEQSSPTYAGSPSERSQNIDNSERSTNSGDDETDLRVTVKDQLSLTFEKEEHKAAVCTDVSPRKRTSFFAWKSDTGHESWTLNKESRCEESQATCSVESVQDKLLVDDMSCETLVRVGGVASGQIDDAAPAVPPHVDPSVFAELPTEVQQELLNEWRSTNINSKPGVNCAKTSHEITLVDLPGVDYSVFKELPQDVQDDILEQHKHKKRTLSGPSSHTDRTLPAKRPRTIKTPSKKSASKSKNIRDFFAQK